MARIFDVDPSGVRYYRIVLIERVRGRPLVVPIYLSASKYQQLARLAYRYYRTGRGARDFYLAARTIYYRLLRMYPLLKYIPLDYFVWHWIYRSIIEGKVEAVTPRRYRYQAAILFNLLSPELSHGRTPAKGFLELRAWIIVPFKLPPEVAKKIIHYLKTEACYLLAIAPTGILAMHHPRPPGTHEVAPFTRPWYEQGIATCRMAIEEGTPTEEAPTYRELPKSAWELAGEQRPEESTEEYIDRAIEAEKKLKQMKLEAETRKKLGEAQLVPPWKIPYLLVNPWKYVRRAVIRRREGGKAEIEVFGEKEIRKWDEALMETDQFDHIYKYAVRLRPGLSRDLSYLYAIKEKCYEVWLDALPYLEVNDTVQAAKILVAIPYYFYQAMRGEVPWRYIEGAVMKLAHIAGFPRP